MTIHQPVDAKGDRAQGLLAKGDFGQAVLDELSETGPEACAVRTAVHDARNGANNVQLLAALFRDYCFMTSAYLLEPVDAAYRRTGFYARGRSTLPAQLAVPLKQLADALGHFPYMEYASVSAAFSGPEKRNSKMRSLIQASRYLAHSKVLCSHELSSKGSSSPGQRRPVFIQ